MPAIFTVGHSNLSGEAFLALLTRHGIAQIADVRAFPASRRHPHFAREALAASCSERSIGYRWMPGLGGRRRPSKQPSPHVAWEVEAFRAYADYMDTAEFAAALDELCDAARMAPTAVMCAEARWWQCHRRLISDRLHVEGWDVLHVVGPGRPTAHVLPDFARVDEGRLVYDRGHTKPLDLD